MDCGATDRYKRKVKIEWSSNFAYAIGLITSDGSLNKDGRHMVFTSKDIELANTFKTALGIHNKITKSARGGEIEKKYNNVYFGDVIFFRFLNSIGLYPAKSKTIKKVDIHDNFFSDFVRGFFDGDGTFYTFWDTRWPNSFCYQISFASASFDFITWFKNKLTCLYGVKGVLVRGDGVYNIRYFKGDTRKLFNVMYSNANCLYLERKYNKIGKAFELDKRIHC